MTTPIIVSIEAQNDIRIIVHWYDEQRDGLGEEFYSKLLLLFDKIGSNPEMYGHVTKSLRVATTRKFPHACYFHSTSQLITIVAVQHGRRSDRHWRRRLK